MLCPIFVGSIVHAWTLVTVEGKALFPTEVIELGIFTSVSFVPEKAACSIVFNCLPNVTESQSRTAIESRLSYALQVVTECDGSQAGTVIESRPSYTLQVVTECDGSQSGTVIVFISRYYTMF